MSYSDFTGDLQYVELFGRLYVLWAVGYKDTTDSYWIKWSNDSGKTAATFSDGSSAKEIASASGARPGQPTGEYAKDGTLFVALPVTATEATDVYRSTDGGETWTKVV